ncbi:cytochrome b [Allonocardiopsis opalescens]|uniref:Cytochrome bc1 complex cytochrome b subunit n=1 Tax=Allonocardiopsis opalescens TaxID=1144618 RepID=A0A2T0Q050_9ACTN|nr:ubiquinol-cytochrome c reductase cytochrome b subunit [Allonocardiopsis opalescens]PRX97043.1 menaquinol-cytochrome c reductase cytochrome b subunit precursor [Allonocardiopsis opalescens]
MSQPTTPPKALGALGTYLDERFHGSSMLRTNMRKVFPNHWSFMLGEVALYSFIIVLLTGVFLTLWFRPSMLEVEYTGSYAPLQGVMMSEAYASALHISFDVRGGLLVRQIHHWAALIFVAAILMHMMRVFFTGAFRKPRELNWLIGATLLILAMVEGLLGYSLPDDLLSGVGIRLMQGVALAVPVIGSYAQMFLFDGEFPGEAIIPRLFTVHVLLLPGIMLALVGAHVLIVWIQKHTQYPGRGRTESNVVGTPMYPAFAVKAGAFFFFVFGFTALMASVFQINPIWLFGPYTPTSISAGSQPDFYIGFMEGSLRLFPQWEPLIFGHPLSLSTLIPALVIPGILFTALMLWPFLEAWITGDKRQHHTADRPRNAPTRTALGVTGITFYGVLLLAGANDLISEIFYIDLYLTTWIFRVSLIVGPIIAFIVTRRVCLGLQRRDRDELHHGYESGIVKQLPSGEFIEVHQPVGADAAVELRSKVASEPLEIRTGAVDENGVPDPRTRSPLGKLRGAASRWFTRDKVDFDEHDGGHGDGHAAVEEGAGSGRAAVSSGPSDKH